MQIARDIAGIRAIVAHEHAALRRIALVPTMGNLHEGHLQLVRVAREHADAVLASVYVNPLQFGENEDLSSYPRTPEEDRAALEAEGVAAVFWPDDAVMYPRGRREQTFVEVPGLSDILCGTSRSGHFRGVATVVNRLFNIVQPDVAVFGKKDYQQLTIIRRMVEDLAMPVEIVGVDTVRAGDGLALSSRNAYLTPDERAAAPSLRRALEEAARQLMRDGADDVAEIESTGRQCLRAGGFKPDYFVVRRRADLGSPLTNDHNLVVLAAAWLGRARLIDNLEVAI